MIRSTYSPIDKLRKEQKETCVYTSTAYWVIEAFITLVQQLRTPYSRNDVIELFSSEITYLPQILVEVHKHGIRDTEELREFVSFTARELAKVI